MGATNSALVHERLCEHIHGLVRPDSNPACWLHRGCHRPGVVQHALSLRHRSCKLRVYSMQAAVSSENPAAGHRVLQPGRRRQTRLPTGSAAQGNAPAPLCRGASRWTSLRAWISIQVSSAVLLHRRIHGTGAPGPNWAPANWLSHCRLDTLAFFSGDAGGSDDYV